MSLITYPVATDPRAFLPRSVSLSQDVNARSFASPFGGSEQAVDMLNDRWRLSMELPPCSQPEAAKREAFINALRGQVNHTELYHFGRPYPQGTLASCQGLVYDAPQGGDSITIATTAGATLLAGDMLGVDGLLLQCRADCTADANGLLVVPLANRLRRAVPGLRRASTATYVDGSGVLQTAAVDVPRFQGGQLLVEGEATNLCGQSGALNASPWAGNPAVTPAAEVYLGTIPFWEIAKTTTSTYEGEGQPLLGLSSGQSAVVTIALLAGSSTACNIGLYSTVPSASWGENEISVLSGPATVTSGVNAPARIENLSASIPSIVRISRAPAADAIIGNLRIYPGLTSSTTIGASIKATRVQVVAGLQDGGSYIPTTTAAATRAADIITPVVWQKPTAPFRLVGRPALRYVPGYSESLALDFVEKVD